MYVASQEWTKGNLPCVGQKFNQGDNVRLMWIETDGGYHSRYMAEEVWGAGGNFFVGVVAAQSGDEILVQWPTGKVYNYNAHYCHLEDPKPAIKETKVDLTHLNAVVLPEEVKSEISSVLKQHHNSKKLFEEWGLGEVIEYGKGMTFLFYGSPGTGKTWAAHCIAKAMGTTLLTIGAAEIQSSEPGGASRNIQKAFSTAKSSGKVLLIDECDSLISSRNDVGMILASEINTLLTEIEKYEGAVVLATNRVENLDEALQRRISLIIEFSEPKYEERMKIWEKLLPKKMPLAEDVKLETLAEYKLTGGQIKNCVLGAARLAMSDDQKEVNLGNFEAAITRVMASKNLLGTASRYRQVLVQDVKSSMDKIRSQDLDQELVIEKVKKRKNG